MNGIAGIGQKEADIRGAQDVREARKEEEKTQESQENAAKKDSLSEPRYDKYIPEKKMASADKKGEEKCTGNTDKVDREIEKLKRKKAELEQRLSGAEEGGEEWNRLRKELEQTEAELERKDTDAYRKSHSQFS